MAQPKRKLRDVIAEQQFLESLGASVPQGAPMGEEFAAPDLTQDDYARFGIDPESGVGSGQMDLLPPDLVASILNAEDAVTGDTVGNYVKGATDAFTAGTKKIARGYGQKWDQPDGLSGLTAWEAQRNDPFAVDGNLDKYSNRDWSGNLNIANGLIEAVSAPAAPLFAPVFEAGMKQAGVENGNLSDTFLGRNYVEPVAEMTGIEPQAIFDTTLNATMAAPFAKQIGRAANKGAHSVLDTIDNATGMSELFPEDLLPENRTALHLPRRFSNTVSEVFGRDPDDPGIKAPWLTNAPRAQGELSPWLQDNNIPFEGDMPPIDQPSLEVRNSGGAPVRPSAITDPSDPSFFNDLLAESNRRDRGLLPPEPAPNTTLDQLPSINSNQGESALLLEDASRGIVDDVVEEFPETQFDRDFEPNDPQLGSMRNGVPDDTLANRIRNFEASARIHEESGQAAPDWDSAGVPANDPARRAYERIRGGGGFESPNPMPWSGAYNPAARATADFRQSRDAPDWEAHGIGPNDPARQAYERQRLIMAEQARASQVNPPALTFNEYLRDFQGLTRERWQRLAPETRDRIQDAYEQHTRAFDEADTNRRAGAGGAPNRQNVSPQARAFGAAMDRYAAQNRPAPSPDMLRADAQTEARVMETVRRLYNEEEWNALPDAQREAITAGIRGNVPPAELNRLIAGLDDLQAEGQRRARELQRNNYRAPTGRFGQAQDAFAQPTDVFDQPTVMPEPMDANMRRMVERYASQAMGDHLRRDPAPDWAALGMDENHPARQIYEERIDELNNRDASVRASGRNMWSLPRERYDTQKRVETDLARDREALRDYMRNENYTDRQVNTLSRTAADGMMSRMQMANEMRARLRDALTARGQSAARLDTMTYNQLIDLDRTIGRDGAAIRRDGLDMVADQGVDAIREQVRPFLSASREFTLPQSSIDRADTSQIARYADYKQDAIVKGNKKYDEVDARNKASEARRKAAEASGQKEPVTTLDTAGKPITTFPDGGVLKQVRESRGSDYKHYIYSYESPHLPSRVDLSFSVDENGRADIAIGGDWEANRGILGSAVVRDIARHLKKTLGAKQFAGTRVTGARAGKSIEQNVVFSGVPVPRKPSALRRKENTLRQTIEEAVKTNGYRREGDVTTFADGSTLNHLTDYSYGGPHRMAIFEYKKPGMENSIEIELRINKKTGRADVSILGDNDHINAFGTATVRNMQRYFKNEYGVKQFDGYRVTGANPKREISVRASSPKPLKPSAQRKLRKQEIGPQAARDERLGKLDKKGRRGKNPTYLPDDKLAEEALSPVEMFDKPSTGGKGRGDQGAKSGIMATPNLRDLTPEEARKAARAEPHLIQDKSGQYVGGPRGVRTPEQIKAMRDKFDQEVEKGLAGAQWYGRARDSNETNNSGRVNQSLSSKEQALMSAQAAPDPNMNWSLQLRNDFEAGVPSSRARTGRQAETYLRARTEGVNSGRNVAQRLQDRLGKKTGVYGDHLDPNEPFATTGTNDIWHARQFGYTNNDGSTFSRALTAQEHRFLDYETVLAAERANQRKMGGRSDWTAAEIQAAPWVAGKGASLAKKHNEGKGVASGKKKPMTEEEGITAAGKTYPDFEDKYTANVTRESWPSQNMQMFPEWDMSKASQQERADWDAMAPYLDEGGRDPTYSQDFGMSVRPSQQGVGSFEGQNNPVTISRPLIHFKTEKGKVGVGDSARNMLNMESAASGLMDMQDGSAWNKIITQGGGGDKSSLSIDVGRPLNVDEMQALEAIATKYGFGLANANNGASFLDFTGTQGKNTQAKLRKGLQQEIEQAVGPAKIERGRFEGGYHDLSKELLPENAGKGLATTKTMEAIDAAAQGAPNAKNSLMHSKAQQAKAAANLERILKTELTKGKAREDVKKLLGILAKGGWKGLYDHVQEFGTKGLPAIALPLLLMEKRERKDDLSGVDMSTY